ncbi:Histidine kinase [Caprobacter fermentans]|uniref:Histidine kinase n=2 Tax=Caproicibacter fermentans TaxID=2576756 RepID=A0A6N8I0W6_9FIRM|nr:Histidine kinase [Caproicibacter fermentans]
MYEKDAFARERRFSSALRGGSANAAWNRRGFHMKWNEKMATGIFEQHLRRMVAKKILLLLAVGIALFLVGLYAVTLGANSTNASDNLQMLKKVYISLYQKNRDFLFDKQTITLSEKALRDHGDFADLNYWFQEFNGKCSVKNEVILSNYQGRVVYSSYEQGVLSDYRVNYNAAICHNAKELKPGQIYNAVYYDSGNYSDYIFVMPVYSDGAVLGYVSLYLSGDDWNFYLLNYNYDGAITDDKNNVIYASKPKLIGSSNKFYGQENGICYYNDERFWMKSESLPEYKVKIFSLVYYPKNSALLIGLFVITIMGISWYLLANWMAGSMAKNNAMRIGQLLSEIRIIQKEDQAHRICMDTQDEFNEVAVQINSMLDSIRDLHGRNTELLQLKNTIEMSQLTAQMNPHFLYNTLEIIRNLALFDGERAEKLIVQLTQILRYSIDKSREDVLLEEDMQYIRDYLDIQKCRFGDRLSCTVNIDADCDRSNIPKLVLQPIIENSIKYGFRKKMNIKIEIRGHMEGNMLVLSVKDDGFGMPEEDASSLNNSLGKAYFPEKSYGLHNISRRLFLRYGEESGIHIVNHQGYSFEVILKVIQPGGRDHV